MAVAGGNQAGVFDGVTDPRHFSPSASAGPDRSRPAESRRPAPGRSRPVSPETSGGPSAALRAARVGNGTANGRQNGNGSRAGGERPTGPVPNPSSRASNELADAPTGPVRRPPTAQGLPDVPTGPVRRPPTAQGLPDAPTEQVGSSPSRPGLSRTVGVADGPGSGPGARPMAMNANGAPTTARPGSPPEGPNPFPSWDGQQTQTQRRDHTAAMSPPGAPPVGARPPADSGGFAPAEPMPGPAGDGPDGPTDGPGRRPDANRLQDTEMKLAAHRSRVPSKPKEPNWLLLGLAVLLVLGAGGGVAWWLMNRGDGDGADSDIAAGEAQADTESDEGAAGGTDDAAAPTGDADTGVDQPGAPAVDEPVVDEPTLFLAGSENGPLDSTVTYSIDLVGEPEGALLQVVVDDVPQGQPDALLPDLILPPGRHTLAISIMVGAETSLSTPVEVYVLGDPPPQGYTANLASVDILNEGWVEALRRFDEYRAAGHEGLQLYPLTSGFWNIFVPGLGEDMEAVTSYCGGFGLEVPVDCFARYHDPADLPSSPDTSTPTETTTDQTGNEDDAMVDEGGETTSTSGG